MNDEQQAVAATASQLMHQVMSTVPKDVDDWTIDDKLVVQMFIQTNNIQWLLGIKARVETLPDDEQRKFLLTGMTTSAEQELEARLKQI